MGLPNIYDRNVETIDILPTIADVLNVVPPWPLDGSSVFADSRPEKSDQDRLRRIPKEARV